MKRTFSTTFFRRALFLVLLFGGVTNLWGEDKNLPEGGDLSFSWSSRTNGTFLGGEESSDGKCISDGLWEWNRKGGEGVKMVDKGGNNYCIFKGKATYNAQTRDRYHFDAGTYVFTFYYYFDESGCEYYEPEVSLSADQRHSTIIQPSATYLTNTKTGAYTKHVFVSVPATGYYYIRLISGLNNGKDERFGYWKVNIAEPCHAVLFEAEDQTAWLNINKDGIELQDGYSLEHDDGATPYSTSTEDKNYMELGKGENNNERLCYAFEITTETAGTLIIRSRSTAGWDMNATFDIWSTSMSGDGSLTWENETYTKLQKYFSYPIKEDMWSEASVSLGDLSAGKYILAMRKDYNPMDYDYFIIQTDEEALCAGTFYTVTFDMQGHGDAIAPQSVKENGLVKKPTDPTASGWVFGGWYKEAGCTNQWNFATDKVTAATTLYAKWQQGYEVAYYDEDKELGTETVIAGETPQQYKKYQKKINHDFVGWYNESGLSSPADFTAAINADKNFYGKWTPGLVDNMIVTGNSASTNQNGSGNDGEVTPTSVADPNGFFDHNVWKLDYKMPNQQQSCYAGIRIDRDADYNKDYSNNATGFGFYYKTAAEQTITFCLDYQGDGQKKTQLPSTNGLWKYAYVASSSASNWNGSSIIIYQNATDGATGSWTPSTLPSGGTTYTTPSTGTYYIAEICATQKTTKPEESAATYTVTFDATQEAGNCNTASLSGATITLPEAWRTGHNFSGWYTENGTKVGNANDTYSPTEDITLYAKFSHNWKLMGNWDNYAENQVVKTGLHTFTFTKHLEANTTYWVRLSDGGSTKYGETGAPTMTIDSHTEWNFNKDDPNDCGLRTTAAGDYVFTISDANVDNQDTYGSRLQVTMTYPASVGVNIDYQGHGGNNYTIYTNPNCTIANKDLPQTPSATNYKFWGWYANAECTTPFDFTASISANTTAYAKWTLWETSNYTMHTQNTQDGNKAWFIRTVAGSQSYYIFDFAIPETSYSQQFFVGQGGYWYSQDMGYNKCSKSANWYYGWLPLTNLQGKSDCKITLGSAVGAIGTLKIEDNSCDPNLYISFDPQGYGLSYGTPNQEGWVNMAFVQENASTVWNTTQVTLTSDMLDKNFYVGLAKQGGGYVFSYRSEGESVGFSNNVAFTTMGVLTQANTWRSGNLTSADAGQVGHFQIWTDNTAQNGCCHFVLHYNATFVYNNAQADTHTEYKSCLADNIITFPTPEAKTGYTFDGWFDNSSFTGTKYDAGSEFNLTNTGSKTFYAKWTPKTSHITFNANGGKIEGYDTKVLDYIYDGSTLTLPTPNWTGHHFEGWFTETTGGTQIDNVGGTNKPLEDVEYFAQWTINQHTLTWAGIGDATLTGDYTAAGLVDYGTTLVAPTVSKTGYEFTSWNPAVDATMPDNDVTYTAQWNIINYTITYHNVGASEHTNPATYTITSADIILSAPNARTGYEFGGWYIDSDFQTSITQITTGSHENKDIYAKWTAKQYTITLDKNEGSADGSVTVTYDSHTTTDFSAPTRDNYIIEGFYAEQGCTTKVMNADGTLCTSVENYTDASGNWVKDATCTLYTKWAEKPKVDAMIVTGDNATQKQEWAPEGTLVATNVSDASGVFAHNILEFTFTNITSTYGGVDITPDAGYQQSSSIGATGFGFWYKTNCTLAFTLDVHSGGQMKTELPNTNGAWAYYYFANNNASNWKQDQVTIYVNGRDGDHTTSLSSGTFYISEIRATEITEKFINHTVTFEQPSQGSTSAQIKDGATINSGDEVPEGTEVIFTWNEKSGYEFDNFFDGTNTYTQNPCTLPVNSNLNITTNVKVEVPKYDLTVSVNDDNMGTATGTGKYAKDEEVSLTATPNEHYRFVNWTVEGVEVSTDANYTYTMPNKATTIVANFEAIPQHTITVNVASQCDGQGTVTGSGTYYEGDKVAITATPNTGYAFDKWNDDDTNASREITVSQSQTYTAYFKVDYCSNTFTIQCEDSYLQPGEVTGEKSTEDIHVYLKEEPGDYAASSHGRGYIRQEDGGDDEVYFVFDAPEAGTYKFNAWVGENKNMWLNIYTTDGNDAAVTYKEQTYRKKGNMQLSGTKNEQFAAMGDLSVDLPSGMCIIGLYNEWSHAAYDQIVITADSKVFCPEMYEVNFAANPSDMGTVTAAIKNGATISSGDEVPEDTVVVFTASGIADGYEVINWTDGSKQLAGNVTSFEQTITDNITVTANIALIQPKYTVTATAGEHGTISSGENDYPAGATVTIVTAPATNYKVGSATASNVNEFTIDGNNVSFTMPAAAVDVTINFVFDTVHNLIATGTSTNVGSHIDRHSNLDRITITSIADNTGSFQHNVLQYAINFQSTNDYSAYTVPTDANYSANAKATGYAFWYMADDNIYMEFNVGGEHGIVCKLPSTNGAWEYFYVEDATAATATSGFEIWMNYSKDGWGMSSLTGTVLFSEIQATNVISQEPIVPKVNLTVEVSPDEGGTVTTSPATTTGLTKGTEVTLTASPEDNYRFENWTVNDVEVSTEATYNRIVNATETITANFVRVYTLIVGHDTNIASVTGEGQYAAGESVTVTATAAQSYKFTNWTEGAEGDVLATTSSYTFDMPATDNYTVYANSEVDITYYQITLGPCTNGTITATVNDEPYTGTDLTANTPVVLTATPAEGYGFVQWSDGSRETPHTIYANAETQGYNPWTATFDQIYTVTTEFGKPGSEVTGGGTYPIGGQVTLEAFVSDKDYDLDYNFSHWEQVSGTAPITEHEHDNPLTFTMPAQNLTLKAIYAPVECVDTFVIQCEDDQAYIPWNKQDEDLTEYPNSIPHDGECGPYHDYYKRYHGTGYYDYKKATSAEMYYPIELPASTYKFEVWSASNGNRNCWMNLYVESDDADPEVVYKDVNYKKTNYVTANHSCGEGGDFAISGTIDNVVLNSPKSVIIGLYCGEDYGAFDQIKITANQNVFCHELSTETFTINSGETKEIPVCGVNNLIIYDGGQANNEENVEVKTSVKHIRQVKQLNVWEDFALPFTATSIQVEDPDDHNMYDIYPAIQQYDDKSESWKVTAGYFLLEELLHDEMATVIGTEFRQRWEKTKNLYPQENIPYIIEFTSTQSDGYFQNTYITYGKTGSTEVRGYENATVDHGSWPTDGTKPTYHYVANNSVVPVYPNDAYVLNDDHTEFVLTDHPEILPFHCYIQASAETKAKAPRLRLVGGGSTPTLIPVVEALNVDAEGVFKFIMDDKVYILRNGVLYNAVGQHVK